MDRIDVCDRIFNTTNKLEEAQTLLWVIFEKWFDSNALHSEAEMLSFASAFNTMADLIHLAANVVWDCRAEYRRLEDEIAHGSKEADSK